MNNGSTRSSEEVSLKAVKITDSFWSGYQKLVKEVVLPYQWEVMNDRVPEAEPSHVIKNLRIAAGLEDGEFYGFFFQDTDLAKWLEAVAYILETYPDPELEKLADEAIDLVEKAQQPDGYLNTYFTIKKKGKRWTNLYECHELYTAGHFIEAGVAYYQATGKRKLLDIVCRFADYIDTVFGPEPGKLQAYDGHQEIELALVKLYKVTGEKRYLELSKFFLDERGKEPFYFEIEWEKRGKVSEWNNSTDEKYSPGQNRQYNQTHLPVREQKEAVGHAVRLLYMLTGMADVAKEYNDKSLLQACRNLWENIVTRQMYITGGIGSTSIGEAFTFDYDLPNDTIYAETCASIGLITFAHRMLQIENKSVYADVIEKALYNIIIGSMAKDGKHYFYVNPLEVFPEASEKNPIKRHVKPRRQKWYSCACCPPNLARLIASLGLYIFTKNSDTLFIHQYAACEAELEVAGSKIKVVQESAYPWNGEIKIGIVSDVQKEFNIALRIPGWCRKYSVDLNGNKLEADNLLKEGYLYIRNVWSGNDQIHLVLDMPVEMMEANPLVRANAGKVALQRGPVVYCIEEEDNGDNLSALSILTEPEVDYDPELFGGVHVIKIKGYRRLNDGWENKLYKPAGSKYKPVNIKAIPYYLWGNRTPGEMMVWIRRAGNEID
ncbi:MAG: glycoside hydrolase family 127 protein [Clostridiaceae bacterium]|nr:glycoside hydrolase family 127 protein [Clostridiaceae bacterium]